MARTLKPCEIIVADDASVDGSRHVRVSYPLSDWSRINAVFHQKNVDDSRNRNSALQQMRGTHVGVLDGENLFAPDKLEPHYDALRRLRGARGVYSNFEDRCAGKTAGLELEPSAATGRHFYRGRLLEIRTAAKSGCRI